MATQSVAVRTELVDHDHGHWCRVCMFATAVRATLLVQIGPRPAGLQTVVFCTECEGEDVELTDEPTGCSWEHG